MVHNAAAVFFFIDRALPEIYTLSLHDALPISGGGPGDRPGRSLPARAGRLRAREAARRAGRRRSEEHTSELQSHSDLVCRLLLEKKDKSRATKAIRDVGATITQRQ